MKKFIRNTILALLVLVMGIAIAIPTTAIKAAVDTSSVGALVDTYAANGKTYTLDTESRIFVVSNNEPQGELLQTVQLIQKQFASLGYPSSAVMEMVWGPKNYAWEGDIVICLDTSSNIGAEGYKLEVAETSTITASDVDGLIYGSNMLMKHFNKAKSTSILGFTSTDVPDTTERVVMLDTGRKYYTKEWICNFIRQISWMGYNTIEFHFSEDGGFRADFWDPTYYTEGYSPQNDFTWLCGSKVQSWVKEPYTNDPDANKYLTTAELVEILNVAKDYHIDVIPSFDSPAHMDYITWKFEQNYKSNTSYSFKYNGTTYKASTNKGCINYTGTTGSASPSWPYYTTINIKDSLSKSFVFALYADIADFFKVYAGSTNFNIGADEVNLSNSKCKWSFADFPGYVNDLDNLLNSKGYTVRMFNDFIGTTQYSSSGVTINDFNDDIEILYWNSPFDPSKNSYNGEDNYTKNVDYFINDGRVVYNCIQTHCYYVLRVVPSSHSKYPNMDARNPKNQRWPFYHSTEESIYNEWTPNDVSEKGQYAESATKIPSGQLGGAYFLIWNDYAALNTESQVWNGAPDAQNSSTTYYLFDRMWSNTIKMWNSDVNKSVGYSDFATIRKTFGYFPGYTSCSAAASLPAATNAKKAYLADHSSLTAVLTGKISNEEGNYTVNSYAAYENAYDSAVTLNASYDASATDIENAIATLNSAKANLVTISALKTSVASAITAQGSYTDDSWKTYAEALESAKKVLNNPAATQSEVNSANANLENAFGNLELKEEINDSEFVLSIDLLSTYVRYGKQVGIKVITTNDITSLSVDGVNLNVCAQKEQYLKSYDENVIVWVVYFDAPKTGSEKKTVKYNVCVNNEERETFKVTFK